MGYFFEAKFWDPAPKWTVQIGLCAETTFGFKSLVWLVPRTSFKFRMTKPKILKKTPFFWETFVQSWSQNRCQILNFKLTPLIIFKYSRPQKNNTFFEAKNGMHFDVIFNFCKNNAKKIAYFSIFFFAVIRKLETTNRHTFEANFGHSAILKATGHFKPGSRNLSSQNDPKNWNSNCIGLQTKNKS